MVGIRKSCWYSHVNAKCITLSNSNPSLPSPPIHHLPNASTTFKHPLLSLSPSPQIYHPPLLSPQSPPTHHPPLPMPLPPSNTLSLTSNTPPSSPPFLLPPPLQKCPTVLVSGPRRKPLWTSSNRPTRSSTHGRSRTPSAPSCQAYPVGVYYHCCYGSSVYVHLS